MCAHICPREEREVEVGEEVGVGVEEVGVEEVGVEAGDEEAESPLTSVCCLIQGNDFHKMCFRLLILL